MFRGGYAGKILRIDLDHFQVKELEYPEEKPHISIDLTSDLTSPLKSEMSVGLTIYDRTTKSGL